MSDGVQPQRSALLSAHDQSLNVTPMRKEIIPISYPLLLEDVQPSVSSGPTSNSQTKNLKELQLHVNMRHLRSLHNGHQHASSVEHKDSGDRVTTTTSSNVHTTTNHSSTFVLQGNHSTILGKRKTGVLDEDFNKPTRLGREAAKAFQLKLDTQRDRANTSSGSVKEGDLDAEVASGLGAFTNVPLAAGGHPHGSPTAVAAGGTGSPQHASPTKSTRKSARPRKGLVAFWDNLGDDIGPATDSGVSTRSSASIKRHKTKSVTPEDPGPDNLEAFWDRLGDDQTGSDSSVREISPTESGVSSAPIKLRKQSTTMDAEAVQLTERRPKGNKGKQPVRDHPCFNNGGPASGSRVTLDRTRAPSMHDTEIDEGEGPDQSEDIDIEGWSNMLRQIYLTRKNLSEIFGDEPADCQKLLSLLRKIDDNKNWVTRHEASSTRLAKRLKKIYLSCEQDVEAETRQVASRILDNFSQRFSNRRFP